MVWLCKNLGKRTLNLHEHRRGVASADEGDERGLDLSLRAQQPSIIVASVRHAAANPSLSAQPQQSVLAFVRSHRRQTWRPCLQGREVGRQHAAALGCRRAAASHAPDGLRAAVGERPRPGA